MTDETHFKLTSFNLTDVLLVNEAMANQGPATHPQLNASLAPGAAPIVVLRMSGGMPHDVDPDGVLVCSPTELISLVVLPAAAQFYASLTEVVSKWPAADQARFHSQVDQFRMSYRTADRKFREGF